MEHRNLQGNLHCLERRAPNLDRVKRLFSGLDVSRQLTFGMNPKNISRSYTENTRQDKIKILEHIIAFYNDYNAFTWLCSIDYFSCDGYESMMITASQYNNLNLCKRIYNKMKKNNYVEHEFIDDMLENFVIHRNLNGIKWCKSTGIDINVNRAINIILSICRDRISKGESAHIVYKEVTESDIGKFINEWYNQGIRNI